MVSFGYKFTSKMILVSSLMLLLWTSSFVEGITLRIRLASGVMKRVDVSEEDSMIALHHQLVLEGVITNTSLIQFQQLNISSSTVKNGLAAKSLRELGVSAGAIFDIKETVEAAPLASESKSSSSSLKQASHKVVKKKTVSSMADIKARKAQLVKIARQKPTRECVVAISPTLGESILSFSFLYPYYHH